jgi:hypothetical protein
VKDFQSAAELEASGIATVETQKRLYASDAPKPESSAGESTAVPASGPSRAWIGGPVISSRSSTVAERWW